jgi:2-keto-4-pentenoate hydratase/2-oxohepta-3-ene-1,7-dioic acid hydratase in catechol pathway
VCTFSVTSNGRAASHEWTRGNTGEMVFNCFEQVAHLSEAFTLEPGDVIATGTPAGVGAARQPFPEGLLKVGDVVRVEIEGIGELQNTVVDEPDG